VGLEPGLSINSEELMQLTKFTTSVFSDLFQKSFDPTPEKFPYWLAPVKPDIGEVACTSVPKKVIDWDILRFVHENPELSWSKDMEPEYLLNQFFYDPWDGRKRYFPLAIDTSLRASDPPPAWTPQRRWMKDIVNYTLSLSKNSRPKFLEQCDWDQPVLRVEHISYRRNFLDRATEGEKSESSICAVCPQPLRISPVSHLAMEFQQHLLTY
jgi:endoribonuclease Dicer